MISERNVESAGRPRVTFLYEDVYWPRFKPMHEEQVRNLSLLMGLAFWSSLVSVGMTCLHLYFLAPLASLILVGGGYSWIRQTLEPEDVSVINRRWAPPPFLVGGLSALTLPFVGFALWNSPLAYPSLFVFVVLLLCRFSGAVTKHFVWYVSADQLLSWNTQNEWRERFTRLWPIRESGPFTAYRIRLWALVVAAAGGFAIPVVFADWSMPAVFGWLLLGMILSLGLFGTCSEPLGLGAPLQTWLAIQTYFNSPPPVPWDHPSWSSQGGELATPTRRTHLVVTTVLLSALLVPFTEALPLRLLSSGRGDSSPHDSVSLSTVTAFYSTEPLMAAGSVALVVGYTSLLSVLLILLVPHLIAGSTLNVLESTL